LRRPRPTGGRRASGLGIDDSLRADISLNVRASLHGRISPNLDIPWSAAGRRATALDAWLLHDARLNDARLNDTRLLNPSRRLARRGVFRGLFFVVRVHGLRGKFGRDAGLMGECRKRDRC
jgi:hypothetical protein